MRVSPISRVKKIKVNINPDEAKKTAPKNESVKVKDDRKRLLSFTVGKWGREKKKETGFLQTQNIKTGRVVGGEGTGRENQEGGRARAQNEKAENPTAD